MNDRQNAQQIIAFGAPERVLTGVPAHTVAFHGANHEGFHGGGHHLPVGSEWTDIWGVQWRREQEGVMGFPRGHPLSDLPDALDRYAWPDPDDPRICNTIYQQAAGWDAEAAFLVGSHRDTLWEKSYMLVGMESMMVSFHLAPAAAREVLHRIMDFHLGIARHYAAVGVEMVTMTDDLGTQRGLLLSPQIDRALELQDFLGLASIIEYQLYPINAMYALQREGLPIKLISRRADARLFTESMRLEVEQLMGLSHRFSEAYRE